MPGTNNFLVFNPSANNQESDGSYAVDVQRINGLQPNDIFPSPLANKLFFQASTFITGFAQMMANKGYNMSDADVNALAAVLANVVTEADLASIINVAYRTAVRVNNTGNTTKNTIWTTALPAMGLNGSLIINFFVKINTQGAGSSSIFVTLNGADVVGMTVVSSSYNGVGLNIQVVVANRNSLTTQLLALSVNTNPAATPTQQSYNGQIGVNLGIPITLNIKVQSSANSDSQSFEGILVETLT